MSDLSANLSMPYIQPSQAQKHVAHNEALRQIDALLQLSVQSATQTTPIPAPNDGDRFLLPAGSTGIWAGNDGKLAVFQDPAWVFYAPKDGWMAWIEDEGKSRFFDGTDWVEPSLQNLEHLGIQTTADTTNRLAVAAPATLLTHEGAGHQLKINKNAVTDTASLLFQTGWSGRAEMGTAGSDDFSIKVSPDGTTWTDALRASSTQTVIAALENTPVGQAAPAVGSFTTLTASGQADISSGRLRLNGNDIGGQSMVIANDAVGVFTPPRIGGFAMITLGGNTQAPQVIQSALVFYDVGITSLLIDKNTGFTNVGTSVDVTISNVTGTTGTTGRVMVSVQFGVMKIENRAGGARDIQVTFL